MRGRRDAEQGASGVEYAVVLAAIALVIYLAVAMMGGNVSQTYDDFGTKAGSPNTNALQRRLQDALGISSGLSPIGQMNACNGAAGKAGSGSGSSPSAFNEACASALTQSLFPNPADFMAGMGIPVGASAAQRQSACASKGLTGAASSSCVATSATAFAIMNGSQTASSWASGDLPVALTPAETAFNSWVNSRGSK